MIEHYVASLSLNRGLRVLDYATVDELEAAAGEKGACLRFGNKYLVEKSALVVGRDKVVEELEKLTGFPMKMAVRVKKKPDGTEEKVETPDWSEAEYVNNFRRAILSGSFVHELFPADSKTLEEKLQSFVDSLGAFPCDAKRPERQRGTTRFPQWVKDRVKVIFDNGTQSRWWDVMAKENIAIEPLNGDRAKDEIALCRAIKERETRRELEEAKRYA